MHNLWFLFFISNSLQKFLKKKVIYKYRSLGKDGISCNKEDGVMREWWLSLYVFNITNRHLQRMLLIFLI